MIKKKINIVKKEAPKEPVYSSSGEEYTGKRLESLKNPGVGRGNAPESQTTQFGEENEPKERMSKEELKEIMSGNDLNLKYKTPEERKTVYKAYCDHIAKGFMKNTFPECSYRTIEHYCKAYPTDFPPEQVAEAERRGLLVWEQMGMAGVGGKLDGFNANAWKFIQKNKNKLYRDSIDHTTDGEQIKPMQILYPKPNENEID